MKIESYRLFVHVNGRTLPCTDENSVTLSKLFTEEVPDVSDEGTYWIDNSIQILWEWIVNEAYDNISVYKNTCECSLYVFFRADPQFVNDGRWIIMHVEFERFILIECEHYVHYMSLLSQLMKVLEQQDHFNVTHRD